MIKANLGIHEVTKIYELEPLELDGAQGRSIEFRIEINKSISSDIYYPRVYRKETFRLVPTFPQMDGKPTVDGSDEIIVIEDNYEDWQSLSGRSSEEVLSKVVSKIKTIFNLN
jgi:hypothetical protein